MTEGGREREGELRKSLEDLKRGGGGGGASGLHFRRVPLSVVEGGGEGQGGGMEVSQPGQGRVQARNGIGFGSCWGIGYVPGSGRGHGPPG